MRWEGNRESDNVEDYRTNDGGGGGGFGIGGRGIGIGAIVVALIGGAVLGVNPLTLLGLMSGSEPVAHQQAQRPPADDRMARFVSTVLADTEDVWTGLFKQAGAGYQQPRLALYRGRIATGCGQGQAVMGPFYCPADQKVYIDLSFYDTLRQQLGAPGDFAQAYVIAHEVGHHVQNLMGISERMARMQGRVSQAEYNAMSVRVELQADCFAGVWAHHAQNARQILDQGDVEEAMNAAARIGDDALQSARGGAVVPESFTHGTSAQRQRWFSTGLRTGSVRACDTFARGAV